jgi:hypothetical protein
MAMTSAPRALRSRPRTPSWALPRRMADRVARRRCAPPAAPSGSLYARYWGRPLRLTLRLTPTTPRAAASRERGEHEAWTRCEREVRMLFKPADGGPRRTHGGAELEDDEGWKKPAGKSRGRSEQPTDGVARQCTCGQASAGNARGHGRGMAGSKHQRRPVCRAAVTALKRKSAESKLEQEQVRFARKKNPVPSSTPAWCPADAPCSHTLPY